MGMWCNRTNDIKIVFITLVYHTQKIETKESFNKNK